MGVKEWTHDTNIETCLLHLHESFSSVWLA